MAPYIRSVAKAGNCSDATAAPTVDRPHLGGSPKNVAYLARTESSNPSPSSGESTNFRFLSRRRPLFDCMISLFTPMPLRSARAAPSAMATVIVPGPAVSGKNAMLTGDALFVASGAVGCSDRFRVNRRCHKLPVSTSRTIPLHCQTLKGSLSRGRPVVATCQSRPTGRGKLQGYGNRGDPRLCRGR